MPDERGWREMTLRVYRPASVAGEKQVLGESLVRLHESSLLEKPFTGPMVCHCPPHPGGVVLDEWGR